MPNKKFSYSVLGIVIGLLCLATLYLIDIFGPGSYSSSGTVKLMADGTVDVITSTSSILPFIAKTAFFTLLIALILGAVGIFRKENIYFVLGSFCFGLAPILIYTTGTIFSFFVYFVISLIAFGIYALKRARQE